jgi:hypothetical protein
VVFIDVGKVARLKCPYFARSGVTHHNRDYVKVINNYRITLKVRYFIIDNAFNKRRLILKLYILIDIEHEKLAIQYTTHLDL